MKKRWKSTILFVAIILLVIFIIGNLIGNSNKNILQDEILIIPINGILSTSDSGLPFEASSANVDSILSQLKKAKENANIKAIILEINSPGGTVVASRELANAVKSIDKPVVAVIREVGASGAYWVASSADVIIADELSITGSIGVIGSYLQFSKIMQDYGITYERLVAGEYKDLGTPFKELKQDEKNILQSKLNKIQEIFINEVKENRKLRDTKRISTGEFLLGIEAKELGLVDKFGNRDTAIEEAKKLAKVKSPRIVEFKEKRSLFNLIRGVSANNFYYLGRGIGAELKTQENPSLEINAY